MYLLDVIMVHLKVTLSSSSWIMVMRADETLLAGNVPEHFIDRLKSCRLRGGCHLFPLQTLVELLSLLMFATLLTEGCHELRILLLEPVLLDLHVYYEISWGPYEASLDILLIR